MTREEQIQKEAVSFCNKICPQLLVGEYSFIQGAEWADEHPKSSWISVEDDLPKQDEEVIVLCNELKVAPFYKISFGHIVDKTIYKDYNGWNIPGVIYWFQMPKIPKE